VRNATRCALVLFGCWGAAGDIHAQNLLKNGSFELPGNLPGNSQQTYQNAIGDWQVAGGVEIFQCPGANNSTHGLDFPGSNYCSANDGSQYLNLTTGGPAKVWQSVQTEKNALYFARFMVAAAKDPSLHPQVRATANDGTSDSGTTLGSTTFSAPASHQPDVSDPKRKPTSHALIWTEAEFSFRAASGTTTITLSPVQLTPEDASFVDNVRLEASRFEVNRPLLWFGIIFLGLVLGYFIMRRRGRGLG
jgi:hypothetical protein